MLNDGLNVAAGNCRIYSFLLLLLLRLLFHIEVSVLFLFYSTSFSIEIGSRCTWFDVFRAFRFLSEGSDETKALFIYLFIYSFALNCWPVALLPAHLCRRLFVSVNHLNLGLNGFIFDLIYLFFGLLLCVSLPSPPLLSVSPIAQQQQQQWQHNRAEIESFSSPPSLLPSLPPCLPASLPSLLLSWLNTWKHSCVAICIAIARKMAR